MKKIVLASSSQYRKQLLQRILPDFESASPDIDESSLANEAPDLLAARLSQSKAEALMTSYPNALIIGSDQVAWLNGKQLHKPGNRENNIAQLEASSGQTLTFYTGLCLLNSQTGENQTVVEQYRTTFRHLTRKQIEHYVDKEKAFDCAGGFRMEDLGISLFEKIEGNDPSILIGLPLIQLINLLSNEGIDVLSL